MAKSVCVLILNWNNWQETIGCVESVQASYYPNVTVIVIDNGSTDASEEHLRQQLSGVNILQTGRNLGYAGGNNVGIRLALERGADWVLILNNDCRVDPSCISELVRKGQSVDECGVVSPKVYAHDKVISHAGSDFDWKSWYITSSRGAGEEDSGQFDAPSFLEVATGDCLMVRRTALEAVGLLDESYFLYYEDTDWCLRARRAGFSIIYQPLARAWHPGSLSTGGVEKPIGAYYVLRNKLYFVQRYGGGLARIRNWIHFLLSLVKNMIYVLAGRNRQAARARLAALKDFVLHRRGINQKVASL